MRRELLPRTILSSPSWLMSSGTISLPPCLGKQAVMSVLPLPPPLRQQHWSTVWLLICWRGVSVLLEKKWHPPVW